MVVGSDGVIQGLTGMSTHKTADGVKQRHIEAMGEELGSLFHALQNELSWLYLKWDQYVKLFGTEPSQVELLDQVAGQFFGTVQEMYWETSMLHIARLTDPPMSCGKDPKYNLTIKELPSLISDCSLKEDVQSLIGKTEKRTDFCRKWRNKRFAHRDKAVALGKESLKDANPEVVEAALGSISEVLNAVSNHYMKTTYAFDTTDGKIAGLIRILEAGLPAEKERRDRGEEGIV